MTHQHQVKKVKRTFLQALRLCTGRTAHRGSRGIALLFHDRGTRRGWGVSVTPWSLFTPGKDPVLIVQEDGWAPGLVWTGVENLTPHHDSIPGPSTHSQSLYGLRYPAQTIIRALCNCKMNHITGLHSCAYWNQLLGLWCCSLAYDYCFARTWCLHLQGWGRHLQDCNLVQYWPTLTIRTNSIRVQRINMYLHLHKWSVTTHEQQSGSHGTAAHSQHGVRVL